MQALQRTAGCKEDPNGGGILCAHKATCRCKLPPWMFARNCGVIKTGVQGDAIVCLCTVVEGLINSNAVRVTIHREVHFSFSGSFRNRVGLLPLVVDFVVQYPIHWYSHSLIRNYTILLAAFGGGIVLEGVWLVGDVLKTFPCFWFDNRTMFSREALIVHN